MPQYSFEHLVLLIGTNPLPNFVVAEHFLKQDIPIKKIWLVHSEENDLQAGTKEQTDNLEKLLRTRWEQEQSHSTLQFPLEKISLSDVSHATQIRTDLKKMWDKLEKSSSVHLNYTGGTKSMSTHVYAALQKADPHGQHTSYSYLDARNFRLIDDEQGVVVDDLRKDVQLTFAEMIGLHDFVQWNQKKNPDFSQALKDLEERLKHDQSLKNIDGLLFEEYISKKIETTTKSRFHNQQPIEQNWEIRKSDWGNNNFELDVILLHGYQLTGISCATSSDKKQCKHKGFEIILRIRQIGGDEAKAIVATGMKSNDTRLVQKELMYDTGGNKKNIQVLGRDDLKNDLFIRKIQQFIFG